MLSMVVKNFRRPTNVCIRVIGSKDVQVCDEKMEAGTCCYLASHRSHASPTTLLLASPLQRLTKQPDPFGQHIFYFIYYPEILTL